MPYKHNEPRRHKIPKAKYKVSNWREYGQALQQRGSLTVWVTPEALEAWAPARTGQRGRPTSYSDIVIELLATPGNRLDAVVQCGTNMSLMQVSERLEPALGIPIIGINAALFWYALRENGFTAPFVGAGMLLRDF